MIEKFNGIFYLIIYLVHFIGVGVYAFQTIFGTKSFMERFGIDPSGAIMIRMAGAFMLAVFLMSIYVGFIRPGGLENTWGFLNLVFINNLCIFLCNFYSIKINKTGVIILSNVSCFHKKSIAINQLCFDLMTTLNKNEPPTQG